MTVLPGRRKRCRRAQPRTPSARRHRVTAAGSGGGRRRGAPAHDEAREVAEHVPRRVGRGRHAGRGRRPRARGGDPPAGRELGDQPRGQPRLEVVDGLADGGEAEGRGVGVVVEARRPPRRPGGRGRPRCADRGGRRWPSRRSSRRSRSAVVRHAAAGGRRLPAAGPSSSPARRGPAPAQPAAFSTYRYPRRRSPAAVKCSWSCGSPATRAIRVWPSPTRCSTRPAAAVRSSIATLVTPGRSIPTQPRSGPCRVTRAISAARGAATGRRGRRGRPARAVRRGTRRAPPDRARGGGRRRSPPGRSTASSPATTSPNHQRSTCG